LRHDIGKLVNAINRVGIQNIALLSRLTGMPVETVRFTVKKRFPELGLFVGLQMDYDRIGLQRDFTVLDFAPEALEFVPELLRRLAKVALLTYHSREILQNRFIANFTIPIALKRDFYAFLDQLVKEKIILEYKIEAVEWIRNIALRSEYYDFNESKWDIDWEKVGRLKEPPPAPVPAEPLRSPDVDLIDILLIKELELQAWRSIAEIGRKLGINDRTIRWHYDKHVASLINSFFVHRLGLGAKGLTKLVGLIHEFHDLSKTQLDHIRLLFNNFPFTWNEGGRDDGYYRVVSTVPNEHFVEALQFLNKHLPHHVTKWEAYTLDLSFSCSYTIPYENFKDKTGWFFNSEEAMQSVLEVMRVKKIRRS